MIAVSVNKSVLELTIFEMENRVASIEETLSGTDTLVTSDKERYFDDSFVNASPGKRQQWIEDNA